MESVEAMFGADAVKLALDEPRPAYVDDALLAKLDRMNAKGGPGFVRSWALAQPWPLFCAIVRVLSGEHARTKRAPVCILDGNNARCGRFPFSASTNLDNVTCPDCLAIV